MGSNTVHLVAVDARAGGRPTPMSDWKTGLRLVEMLDDDGAIDDKGLNRLTSSVAEAADLVGKLGCEEMIEIGRAHV